MAEKKLPSIKDLVKDNKVFFSHYRANHLYYHIWHGTELYMFPVPIDDTGDATFTASDKAILFMRYIRKAIDEKTFVPVKSE